MSSNQPAQNAGQAPESPQNSSEADKKKLIQQNIKDVDLTLSQKQQKKKSIEELMQRLQVDENKRKLQKLKLLKIKEDLADKQTALRAQQLNSQAGQKKLSQQEVDSLVFKLTQDAERRKQLQLMTAEQQTKRQNQSAKKSQN